MMGEKRVHEYEITFKHLKNNKGEILANKAIDFVFANHDDIDVILEKLGEKNLFNDAEQTKQFVIGLKLFGDILIRNKDMELFSEIQPAFISFMKKLKGK
jgi:hypothetical protein